VSQKSRKKKNEVSKFEAFSNYYMSLMKIGCTLLF